jgi:hypothetical protein
VKKWRTARELVAIYNAVINGDSFCAGDEDCLEEANVYLFSSEEGDVYMCAKHATEELDK